MENKAERAVSRRSMASPIGMLRITSSAEAVLGVEKMANEQEKTGNIQEGSILAGGAADELARRCEQELQEYFAGKREVFDLPIAPEGTDFQKKVWRALTDIPYGQTRTYGELAAMTGNARASRAVGMANHHNPLLILIPCHRVIGRDGGLTGFAAGVEAKKYLLDLESRVRAQAVANTSPMNYTGSKGLPWGTAEDS